MLPWWYRVLILNWSPCSTLKLRIALEPTRAPLPWNPSSKRASCNLFKSDGCEKEGVQRWNNHTRRGRDLFWNMAFRSTSGTLLSVLYANYGPTPNGKSLNFCFLGGGPFPYNPDFRGEWCEGWEYEGVRLDNKRRGLPFLEQLGVSRHPSVPSLLKCRQRGGIWCWFVCQFVFFANLQYFVFSLV